MSKEIEALYRIANANNHFKYDTLELMEKDYQIVYKGLQRLEAIDNANPSKALECLEKLDDMFYLVKRRTTENGNHEEYEFYPCETEEYDTIKQALQQKIVWKNIHNTKVKIPLCSIVNGMNQQERFKTIEHIYYHWEEMKESLEAEIGTIKTEKENLESKAKKQEKVTKIIINKNVEMWLLKDSATLEQYNNRIHTGCEKLTQNEFDLLKRYCNENI